MTSPHPASLPIAARQLDDAGRLRHFLSTEGLSPTILNTILETASGFIDENDEAVKKAPLLRGKTVANLFFENSTRTLTTFELAAKRLSADVLNINIRTSSTAKGESLLDTLHNLQAMLCDMFVVRHAESGAVHFIADHVAPGISIINAGSSVISRTLASRARKSTPSRLSVSRSCASSARPRCCRTPSRNWAEQFIATCVRASKGSTW